MLHSTVKYVLFLFNLIFVLTGIVLAVIGFQIKNTYLQYEGALDEDYVPVASAMITVGVIIFLIAFFGCCGAGYENQCMLLTYSVLLAAVFIMELVAGVSAYVLSDKVDEVIGKGLKATMRDYQNSTETKDLWDTMQQQFECCGATNSTDWFDVLGPDTLPPSCCPGFKPGEGQVCLTNDVKTFSSPCLKPLEDYIRDDAVTMGSTAIGIAFVQLLGIILACYMNKSIRASNYETV